MNQDTYHINFENKIRLFTDSKVGLLIWMRTLKLTQEKGVIKNCYLTFQVSPETYQNIDRNSLFNLKSEIRSPISGGEFKPSFDIEIEATLDPTLLPKLAENATNAEKAANYLQQLSQEQSDHPILSTYSWYALEVKQKYDQGETGYTTLWKYLNPSLITADGIDPEKINDAMNNFAKKWADTNGLGISEDVITQGIEEMTTQMTQTFAQLTNSFSEMTEEIVSETMAEMNIAFEDLTDTFSEIVEEIDIEVEKQSIFEIVIDFFKEEEWQFQLISQQQTLHLVFQGNNGKWDCYAKAKEKEQQFIFYSICPLKTPESKKVAIAEYIIRANYGMIIGNFEMNFSDGEIRYKTSIDVEGDRLNSALIKRLVYANVTMIDEYLPGIIAIIEKNMSPVEAISQCES